MPITDCAGFYDRIVIYGNNFTEIPALSFPGMETDTLLINSNYELLSISPKFWDGSERLVTSFDLNGNTKLKYSLIQFKGYNSKFKFFDGVQFRKYFISLPAFYLIIWLMESPKNFEKTSILKI